MPGTRSSTRKRKNVASPETAARKAVARNCDQEKFSVWYFPGKGRGVVANTSFQKGDFLVHYAGLLRSALEGNKLEDQTPSSYRYFFWYKGEEWCMDATEEPSEGPCLGRLVNHGTRCEVNAKMKVISVNETPALCLFALRDIEKGEEILYDYGIKELPWNSGKKVRTQCQDSLTDRPASKLDCGMSEQNTPPSDLCSAGPMVHKKPKDTGEGNNGDEGEAKEFVELERVSDDVSQEEKEEIFTNSLRIEGRELGIQKECQKLLKDTLPDKMDNSEDKPLPSGTSSAVPLVLEIPKVTHGGNSCDGQEIENELVELERGVSQEKEEETFTSSLRIEGRELGIQKECQKLLKDTLPDKMDNSEDKPLPSGTSSAVPLVLEIPKVTHGGNSCDGQEIENELVELERGVSQEKEEETFTSSLRIEDRELRFQKERQDLLKDALPDKMGCLEDLHLPHDACLADPLVLEIPKVAQEGNSCDKQEAENDLAELERVSDDVSQEQEPETFTRTALRTEDRELRIQKECQDLLKDKLRDKMDYPEDTTPSSEDEEVALDRQGYLMLLGISNGIHEVCSEEEGAKFKPVQLEMSGETAEKEIEQDDVQEQFTSSSSDSEEDPSYDPHNDVDSDDSHKFPSYYKEPNSPCPVTSTSTDATNEATVSSYKKPYRLCIFCNSMKSKLSEHIEKQHHNIDRVASALKLAKKDKQQAFDRFKKEGILKLNKDQAKHVEPAYHRERSSNNNNNNKNNNLIMCNICSGFYAKRYIRRHIDLCQSQLEGCFARVPIPVNLLASDETCSEDFVKNVLNRFRPDEVGALCTKDPVILMIGKRMWEKQKRKMDKKTEVRRSVMTDMRRLSALYLELKKTEMILGELPSKNGDAADLFKRNNFRHLEEAISSFTSSESSCGSDVKAGLKLGIYYLLKSASKILKGSYLIDDQDDLAEEVDKFVQVLELNNNFLFGDAAYKISQQRQVKLRKPDVLPLEADVKKLRDYTVKRMDEVTTDKLEVWDTHRFVELRDLLVCRLTLFNARRGGEPSRLLIREWTDAENDVWLDKQQLENLDPLDKALADTLKITYQSGKGNKHLVPILFPPDTIEPMRKLTDEEIRSNATIDAKNPFVFASINQSDNHVSGWHAVSSVCDNISLVNKTTVTATKNRHRVSTMFALMDVPENDRQFIYKHLGHSEETNQNIYQTPLALKELTVVGSRLQTIDEGEALSCTAGTSFISTETSCEMTLKSWKKMTAIEEEEASYVNAEDGNKMTAIEEEACEVNSEEDLFGEPEDDSTEVLYKPARKYRKWTSEETAIVCNYFRDYFLGDAEKKLQGRNDVLEFLKVHDNFGHDWRTIKTKVMNEVNKSKKMADQRENDWH